MTNDSANSGHGVLGVGRGGQLPSRSRRAEANPNSAGTGGSGRALAQRQRPVATLPGRETRLFGRHCQRGAAYQ
jgi:hypothetical protein